MGEYVMLIYYLFVALATMADPVMGPISVVIHGGLLLNHLPFKHFVHHMAAKEQEQTK